MLADDLGEKVEDIVFQCAGINHMAFYLKFGKRLADGTTEDLYPRLRELAQKIASEKISSPAEPDNQDQKVIGCLT